MLPMADARYRLRAGDPEFGLICPGCASPKAKQARRCRACYRADQYAGTVVRFGQENPNWRGGRPSKEKGERKRVGRPQPQTHPWRAKNALLFRKLRLDHAAD